jgi:hypothetical protein
MPEVLILLMLGGIGGVIAIVYTQSRRTARARTTALADLAARLGWGFREQVPFDALPDLERFELFRPGHSKKLSNLMTSPAGELRAVVFDYAYTVSAGNSTHTRRQTVFFATGDMLALPSFSLRPENFFHRVGAMFGYQDIDLERRPEFSRMYLLRGEAEDRVREVFGDGVVDFFERRPQCCAAGLRRELLYWRTSRLAPPAEIEVLIRDGHELAQHFSPAARRA